MNILKKLTFKNLLLNKKRNIVTIIGITLSVALITAVTSMVVSFKESLINFEKKNDGDFHYMFYGVSNEDINIFKNNRKIDTFYTIKELGYSKIDSKNTYKPYLYVIEMDNKAFNKMGIVLNEGRLPENENEIVVSRHLKTNGRLEYKVGETIKLDIGKRMSGEQELSQYNPFVEGEPERLKISFTKEYKIVGIIERPSNGIEPFSAPGYTVITYLSNTEGNNTVYARYTKEGLKNQYKVTAGILGVDEKTFEKKATYDPNINENDEQEMSKAKYIYGSNEYLIKLETNAFSDSSMKALTIIGSVVIFIIIVTSVFCIRNSFKISVTERIKEYGMLSSIGASSKQIKKSVYYEAFLLGIVGVPLGVLSGLIASYVLIIIVNYLLSDSLLDASSFLIYKVSLIGIIISVILSIITIFLSSTSSARKASKTSPIVNIRKNNDIKINKKKLKCPKIINKLFGIGGKISYKNIKRNKSKYKTTIISIVVSVSVYIALSYFVNTTVKVIKLEYGDYNHNIALTSFLTKYEDNESIINDIIKLDNIGNYSLNRTSLYEGNFKYTDEYKKYNEYYDNENIIINVMSVGKEEYTRYLNKLGLSYDKVKYKGILINNDKKTFEEDNIVFNILDIKKGDILKLKNRKEDTNLDIEVALVTDKRPLGYENYFGIPFLIVSDEMMDNLPKSNSIELLIKSNKPDKLQDDIEKLVKERECEEEVSIVNLDATMKELKNIYLIVAIFLYGFIIVISLIGVTNIFNTISTNMMLRKSEFATLKSIGMTKKEFNKMIFLESFLYSVKSLLIGLPIGIGLSYLIYLGLKQSLVFTYVPPYKGIIISILVVFILIFLLNSYSSKKANSGNIIETIRNENI